MRRWLLKPSLSIASLLIFAGLVEGSLRLAGFQPERPVNPLFSWTTGKGQLFGLGPHAHWKTRVGNHDVDTNAYGMRERKILAKQPEVFRILFLGDSVTFGHGQPVDVTFVRRLEELLRAGHPRVEVLNAGTPGWSTRQQRLFYEQHWEDLDPDLVLVGFVLNDVIELRDGLLEVGLQRGLRIIRWTSWLAERSALVAAVKALYTVTLDPQAKEIRSVAELALKPDDPAIRRALDLTAEEMGLIAALTQEHGHGFGLVLFPFRFQLVDPRLTAPQQRLIAFGEANEVPVLDTLPRLHPFDPGQVLMDADHFTARGHQVVAQAIAAWLEKESLLP